MLAAAAVQSPHSTAMGCPNISARERGNMQLKSFSICPLALSPLLSQSPLLPALPSSLPFLLNP